MTPSEYQRISLTNGDNVKLNEYQTAAVSTAIYPTPLMYPALGLGGELGELALRVQEGDSELGIKEIGDVLWYAANVANDAGLSLEEVLGRKTFIKKDRVRVAWDEPEAILEVVIAAGVVLENIKKTVRDNDGVLCKVRRAKIRNALRDVIAWLSSLAAMWDVSLEECAKINIEKLRSRQERGVLKGDGDSR
jgi:NTP pyrophosphatase (non-canonical NTP hydrolase)